MGHTLLAIRLFFVCLCTLGGLLVWLATPEWEPYLGISLFVGFALGVFVVLVDMLLKGFSLRGLTALTFGLGIGALASGLLSHSPLFAHGDPELLYLLRIAVFVGGMYLGAVIALRGKDDLNLIIPYVRFVPHGVSTPLAVVDTSALIDGRIAPLCESGFFGYGLVIPRFVLDELQTIADSSDPSRKARGRRGLETLNRLRALKEIDLRVHETDVKNRETVDSKLLFVAQSLKAKLLTTDFNLARLASFHKVEWLNLNSLARSLSPEVHVGDSFEIELTRPGKESGQAVGYLNDGSMVVVNESAHLMGQVVAVQVESVLPSAGGKMIFARPCEVATKPTPTVSSPR